MNKKEDKINKESDIDDNNVTIETTVAKAIIESGKNRENELDVEESSTTNTSSLKTKNATLQSLPQTTDQHHSPNRYKVGQISKKY